MGLNSAADTADSTFGMRTNFVVFHCQCISHVVKNSRNALYILGPMSAHASLKKLLLYPSGPGDIIGWIENMASLMSFSENGAIICSYCSMSSRLPS